MTKEDLKKNKKVDNKKIKKLSKIEELEKKLEESKNDYLRVLADFENFRTRNQKELIEAKNRAVANFAIDLLPAIDNFEMSLKMSDNKEMFIKGVQMIHKNLLDTLKEYKIEGFSPKIGEKFNPYLHDPILIEDKNQKPGEILGIIKKGFKHNDKILRPARVQVVKENN